MVYNAFPTCLLFVVVVVVVAVVVLDLLHTRDVEHSKERSSTVIFRASTRFSIFRRKIFFVVVVLLSPCIARLIIFCTGSMFETHTAELAPSVRELAEMEFKAQTSFLSLQHRDWMSH